MNDSTLPIYALIKRQASVNVGVGRCQGLRRMIGKRVQFDEETWEALSAVARDKGVTFQEMADEAFADYLKKHKRPVGLMASLKESVGEKSRTRRTKKT